MRLLKGSLFVLMCTLLLACGRQPNTITENVPAQARYIMDQPYYFLLDLPDFKPIRLVHDSDIASTWGELTLTRETGSSSLEGSLVKDLLRAAKKAGWTQDTSNNPASGALTFVRTEGTATHNLPTRYSLDLSISPGGNQIAAIFRIDAE